MLLSKKHVSIMVIELSLQIKVCKKVQLQRLVGNAVNLLKLRSMMVNSGVILNKPKAIADIRFFDRNLSRCKQYKLHMKEKKTAYND